MNYRLQFSLFLACLVIPGAIFVCRIWNILPLYTDSVVRTSVRTSLVAVSDREGWLLSDISLDRIAGDRIFVTKRDHHRGHDAETCHQILLTDNFLLPCDD